MTRFLPIDRPLVYGDIVAYYPGPDFEETNDRNFCLVTYNEGRGVHLIELATASGAPVPPDAGSFVLPTANLRLVVEE